MVSNEERQEIQETVVASIYSDSAWQSLREWNCETVIAISKADVDVALTLAHGVLLCGGGDVNPRLYGREHHSSCWGISDSRDALELYAVEKATELGLPIMGICRGAQMLNVARGGSLNVDISGRTGKAHGHGTFDIVLDMDSDLAAYMEKQSIADTTHLHHQSIDRVGDGLRAVGWTKDGVVEVVESTMGADQYILGVQFHPEMDDPIWGVASKHYLNDASEIFGHFVGVMRTEGPRRDISQSVRLSTYREMTRQSEVTVVRQSFPGVSSAIIPFDNAIRQLEDEKEFDWLYGSEHDPHRDDGIQFMTDDLCDEGWCPTPTRCLNDDMCLRTVIDGKRRGGIIGY